MKGKEKNKTVIILSVLLVLSLAFNVYLMFGKNMIKSNPIIGSWQNNYETIIVEDESHFIIEREVKFEEGTFTTKQKGTITDDMFIYDGYYYPKDYPSAQGLGLKTEIWYMPSGAEDSFYYRLEDDEHLIKILDNNKEVIYYKVDSKN